MTLGCARNEVDSEELAGRLSADGWELTDDEDADVVLVNTCAFVASAKKDSIDTLLAAADGDKKVVAVGCLAERYGSELAESMPEAAAVLGFDAYASIGERLDDVLAGRPLVPHTPRDRRTLLPITPVERQGVHVAVPGHGHSAPTEPEVPGWTPPVLRRRLENSPSAPLKLASGCDRRCAFCAIPSFRGAFVSRPAAELLAEAHWLAGQGVRELVLVSENSTSYGKDLGDLRLLEQLLPELAAVPGIVRVRLSYLQPAETRPSLVTTLATTPGVAPYFDLSFQHSSEAVLRRMRRFGSTERFLGLLEQVRALAPTAGVRSNVIVGFPGETKEDVAELARFLTAARLDAIGVFGYSDEDGTEAAGYDGKVRSAVVDRRVARMSDLVDELMAQRAEERLGETVEVLVEAVTGDPLGCTAEGRAAHQAPEVDGATVVTGVPVDVQVGDLVRATVTGSTGVDLAARYLDTADAVGRPVVAAGA
ncbi:MAG TPA: 30S ribosomal protein S12 methylthiotransferase RimO [Mycobacteriales bacterium]|nr:30S ribosomal protein S12 methylthiotransferase RimO [Mycobacteriales bacterium]